MNVIFSGVCNFLHRRVLSSSAPWPSRIHPSGRDLCHLARRDLGIDPAVATCSPPKTTQKFHGIAKKWKLRKDHDSDRNISEKKHWKMQRHFEMDFWLRDNTNYFSSQQYDRKSNRMFNIKFLGRLSIKKKRNC